MIEVGNHYDFHGLPNQGQIHGGRPGKTTISVAGITIGGQVLYKVRSNGSKPVTGSTPLTEFLAMVNHGILTKREK